MQLPIQAVWKPAEHEGQQVQVVVVDESLRVFHKRGLVRQEAVKIREDGRDTEALALGVRHKLLVVVLDGVGRGQVIPKRLVEFRGLDRPEERVSGGPLDAICRGSAFAVRKEPFQHP
eukprot:scaffold1016_cov258-Pinguiococcus_pyrenoidosus.AAC.8